MNESTLPFLASGGYLFQKAHLCIVRTFQFIIRLILFLVIVIILLALLCFSPLDMERYQRKSYYAETLQALDDLQVHEVPTDTLMGSWAKAAIMPQGDLRSIGYNRGGEVEGVHDSLYVKVIVLEQGSFKTALVSFDLLMVSEKLAQAVQRELALRSFDFVHFGASHTHNGFGHWDPSPAGQFVLGEYKKEIVELLVSQCLSAIDEAIEGCSKLSLSYARVEVPGSTQNRVWPEGGGTDEYIRCLYLEKEEGGRALLSSFQGHATCLSHSDKKLSGDYPSALCSYIEEAGYDFAMFMAGGMASHRPMPAPSDYTSMQAYARRLADSALVGFSRRDKLGSFIKYSELPVVLREPHFRISPQLRIRPWLFKSLFGRISPSIKYLKLGELSLIGLPCEISGELFKGMEQKAANAEELMITSFNGSYAGYVNADQYYFWNSFEVRDMNWYGPYNGAYFTELVLRLNSKMSD